VTLCVCVCVVLLMMRSEKTGNGDDSVHSTVLYNRTLVLVLFALLVLRMICSTIQTITCRQ
jgi:zona occludens toxin (predicted ATPase)